MEITREEKIFLLKLSRAAIMHEFDPAVKIPEPDFQKYPVLKSHAGAFVTINKNKMLRGCIGYIIGFGPLYDTVIEAAKQAAFGDPRFPALIKPELDDIEIEVSILSEPFPISEYDEIIVGKHGLILEDFGRRALLLPQVPIEHGLNKEEYLSALCEKAGLNGNCWREKQLNLKAFTATVFDEKEMGLL
jgi:AmmeMemoRadiSam system protein A